MLNVVREAFPFLRSGQATPDRGRFKVEGKKVLYFILYRALMRY
jgi:hypothetical protein